MTENGSAGSADELPDLITQAEPFEDVLTEFGVSSTLTIILFKAGLVLDCVFDDPETV